MTRDDRILELAREHGDFMPGRHGDALIFNAEDGATFSVFTFAAALRAAFIRELREPTPEMTEAASQQWSARVTLADAARTRLRALADVMEGKK